MKIFLRFTKDERWENKMKKTEELCREIADLISETKAGRIRWNLEVQTTEGNDSSEKPVENEDGVEWIVDECYVSYYCKHKGKDFCMITYELIKTSADKVSSGNMVFCPPLGVRLFDLRTLIPYSVETSAVLLEQIHQLWMLLMDLYKVDPGSIYFNVHPGQLTIED